MRERIVNPRNATYLREIEDFFRSYLVDNYEERSARLWNRDYSDPAAFHQSVAPMREKWSSILSPPDLRTKGQPEVIGNWIDDLDSYWVRQPIKGGLSAEGVLALPERGATRLVVFQHGLGSIPERAFGVSDSTGVYDSVALRLLEAGYAVLAPFNLSMVEPRNRAQRLARLAGTTMEGLEFSRVQILIEAVADQFDLDVSQMGLWGSSWGGLATQMWAPLDERFEVAISSGFFNNRQRKMVVEDPRFVSFDSRGEEHAFLGGHLLGFGDADLASLICPRSFMVQIGKLDAIGWWPDIVREYEQAEAHWNKLGQPERINIDLHNDGHVIRAEPGVAWMRRWLHPG